MRYFAAYQLVALGGKSSPTAADVTKVLEAAGVDVDAAKVTTVIEKLGGQDLAALQVAGAEKLVSIPALGGGGGGAAAPSAGGAAPAAEAVVEEEPEEESDSDMGMGLFG